MSEIVIQNPVLKTICSMVPVVSTLYNDEVCIGVTDTERYLFTKYGKNFSLPFKEGSPLNPGIRKAQRERTPVIMEKSEANLAKAYFFPIEENGKIIGTLAIAVLLDTRFELDQIVEKLEEQAVSLSKAVGNVAEGVTSLLTMNEMLLHKTNETTIKAKVTDEIVSMIQGISSKTNLLGLNASIEAARSGEAGRSFGVVAKEIQKLSITSKDSITKIDGIIKDISANIEEIDSGLDNINGVSHQQAESIKMLTSTMEEVKNIIIKLHELERKL